jgi:uncharacterized membrane protein
LESFKSVLAKVASYFMRGLLFVAPIGVTFYILISIFNQIDSILQIKIPISAKNEMILPGLGFLIIVLGTAIIGFVSSVWFPNTFLGFFENTVRKLPLVRIVYFSLKDLVSAFVGDKKKFDNPVLVLVDEVNQIHKIGFITQKDLSHFGIENKIMVYFPQSYAFAGDLIIIDAHKVSELNISAAEAMKLIVSGGISTTD